MRITANVRFAEHDFVTLADTSSKWNLMERS